MNKKILGITVILIVCFTVAVFAQERNIWYCTGQIINADTFAVITTFGLSTSLSYSRAYDAKANIRRQLGFPSDDDVRTVGGVNQRIIWDIVEIVE